MPSGNHIKRARYSAHLSLALAALLISGILAAPPAQATYEQVGCFAGTLPGLTDSCKPVAEEKFGEEVQLGGVSGMAVNVPGAGGVKPGTVYAVTITQAGGVWVAMFEPEADGALTFAQAWKVRDDAKPYERCGPALGTEIVEGEEATKFPCKPQIQAQARSFDVDVDQETGNVYVLNGTVPNVGVPMITEYKPDGSAEITRFGQKAEIGPGKTTAESPDKIHGSPFPGGMAVNDTGNVYVFDQNTPDNFYHRLMVFKPQTPGDYEHYVYAGQDHDVGAGFLGETRFPFHPALDTAGNVYVFDETSIAMYDPATSLKSPVCEYLFAKGGITAMAVNPTNGEVFFFSYKKEAGFKTKLIHQLAPCEAGKFKEVAKLEVSPERDQLYALAFDPARQIDPSRPPGVLYGGAPESEPSDGGPGQPGQAGLGYVFAQAKELNPVVEAESATHVGTSTALLQAEIDPKGSVADYAFQYLSETAYEEAGESFAGAPEAPLGGGTLPAVQGAIPVAAAISGLQPGTEYRYRAVAMSHCSSDDEAKVCEDSGEAESFRTYPIEAPGLPDHRAYELVSPTDKSGGQVVPADSRRSSCGRPECKPGFGSTRFPMQSSPDGEAIVYQGTPFSESGGAAIENQYIARRDAKAGWQTVNLTPSLLTGRKGFKAFATDLSKGILDQSGPTLSPEAPEGFPDLYLQPSAEPLSLSALLSEAPPNRIPGNGPEGLDVSYAGASSDLSRVFFKANDALPVDTSFSPEAVDGGPGKANLYEWSSGQLRLVNVMPGNALTEPGASFGPANANAISKDGSHAFWSDGAGQLYVRINGKETVEVKDPGKFLAASSDGSKVLLDDGCLYDLKAEACEQVDEGTGPFEALFGQSEDLSHVYFSDDEDKLYSWSEGATTLIAELGPKDSSSGAEASPAGRWLTFISLEPLTGYDSTGPCEHTGGGATLLIPCEEAFLYDSATDQLLCPSCKPSGESPLGPAALTEIEGATSLMPQPRYLTDSGRLYFDTQDSLTPFDVNEGTEDVYQYEPNGIGTCEREEGCVSLISAGTESIDSNFLTIDPSAKNVFFTTRDKLVLKDKDELVDLYVAREGGGIPAETETGGGICQGEACQPPPVVPNNPTPASASFQGQGNVKKPRAAKKHKRKKRHKHARKHKSKRAANHKRGGAK